VRLALEEAGAEYVDVALVPEKEGGGAPAIVRYLQDPGVKRPPYAPPFLVAGRQVIGQTANILMYLGEQHRLAPRDAAGRAWVNQLQLTLVDFIAEIHDAHHPLGPSLYYEEQKAEAKKRTAAFLAARLPKYLDYFERVIARNGTGPWMVGRRLTYADLSLAQVIAGLQYAFPSATRAALRKRPGLARLHEAAFARPRIRRYLASGRRLDFNNDDVFRRYPELGG
jgi:glutathione S-transferase